MRFGFFMILGLLAAAGLTARASETLSELKVGDTTYTNVVVTTVTKTDIYFSYPGGMGNAKLKQLSPELQSHFGYDAKQAGETEQKQAAANAQFRQQAASQPAPRSSAASPASELSWGTDLPAALNQARSEKKMVLLDFTGSDWCPWCIKFDHEVLATPKFADYARNRLVLVKVDFLRHSPQSSALKQSNRQLKSQFNVEGFPTYILLNDAGKELGRQPGYSKGGPDAFIAKLERFSKR